MLLIKDTLPSTDIHQFKLSSVLIDDNISFDLTSDTYADVNLNFTLEYPKSKIPLGYSVKVHLFKNKHFSQKDIIDLTPAAAKKIGLTYGLGRVKVKIQKVVD